MSALSNYKATAWFVGGIFCGLMGLVLALQFTGWTLISDEDAIRQNVEVAELRRANRQLTDRLFALNGSAANQLEAADLPYDETANARSKVAAARETAKREGKFLMVTFGANWCMDCRTLYRNLNSDEVAGYTMDRFHFVTVDIGKFNRNRALAEELGVDLSRGIPVAIFFDPDGKVVGTTNEGLLEPARRYSSKQILRFLRDIAEREQVSAPDSVVP